jgi:hypothetical protein
MTVTLLFGTRIFSTPSANSSAAWRVCTRRPTTPRSLEKASHLIGEWAKAMDADGYFYYSRKPQFPHYIYEKTVCGLVDMYAYGGKECHQLSRENHCLGGASAATRWPHFLLFRLPHRREYQSLSRGSKVELLLRNLSASRRRLSQSHVPARQRRHLRKSLCTLRSCVDKE